MRRLILFLLAAMLTSMPIIEVSAQSQKPKKITRQTTTHQTEAQKKAEQETAKRRQQAAAEKRRLTEQRQQQTKPLNQSPLSNRTFTVSGVQFTMVGVQGGTFQMGSNDGYDREKPVHSVTLSSYYIGQTEVTQALWKAVMGSNPSEFKGDDLPVERVSWSDCQDFIAKLNQMTGEAFRLPTEAEWEFAARGGNKSRGYIYSGSNELDDVAWYMDNSNDETHPVGTKAPNELGIYDMSGNVREWCQDWGGDYPSSAQTNPAGPASGSGRVYRGGSWFNDAKRCPTTYRRGDSPTDSFNFLGLRLALSK